MNTTPPSVTLLCCGVFEAEVEALRKKHWPHLTLRVLDSILHMRPNKLAERVQSAVDEELRLGRSVVMVYGDCCAEMSALETRPGVVRTRGSNCCVLLLGRDEYRRLAHDGSFFLFPEWTRRWRHIFTSELGLERANAVSLMSDMHRQLLYLDTGLAPVPDGHLRECAEYCGLPYEVRPMSLEPLRAAIQEALDRLPPSGHLE